MKKKIIIIYPTNSISVVTCNKVAEVKVKTTRWYTSINERIHKRAKDLERKI
jgi:hypothetical protein